MELTIQKQEKQIEQLQAQNQNLEEKEKDNEEKIRLLQNLSFNIKTYNDVLKLSFRDYNRESTIRERETLSPDSLSSSIIKQSVQKILHPMDKGYDEVFSIIDCNVSYQWGIDLQKIKISKLNNNTVIVSGISPEYISKPSFEYNDFFSEVRHVTLDKNDKLRHITVRNDEKAMQLLAHKQAKYKSHFEDVFLSGQALDNDSQEINKCAREFIKIILQPIYPHVQFEDKAKLPDAVPLLEYLNQETEFYKSKIQIGQ